MSANTKDLGAAKAPQPAVHFANLRVMSKFHETEITEAGRALPSGNYKLMAVPVEQKGGAA